MQGIYIDGRRPKSKKAIKEAVAAILNSKMVGDWPIVELEATSMFGNEYGGDILSAPQGTYYFVGPDPYTKRNFYGKIVITEGKIKVE